ncbi:flagellar hook-length control protein FliK [Roseomonas genomospecies 6]|uniref:Flagellar hook-length control protein-like C-terminal domain-containing protein n=1 Tax=Roseomonas genomospecies 6 TaxID=214106 RepID=A0A9W7NNC9_9PROT|nr:flagellar hook-length control protein FliK [Roseomonas genomospecies 6]KAA0683613.1 hypothetical protein DS843_04335 [Roseomonas genomospecies 6]
MAIQTNIAPSAFESLVRGQTSPGQSTAPRSDKFASMVDRLISEAATRKRDQAQTEAAALERRNAAADAADQAAANRTADRKAAERNPPPRPEPIRAEPAKPRQSSEAAPQSTAPQSTAKRAAEHAAERRDARASDAAKAGEDAHAARTERREAAANHAASKDAKAASAKAAQEDAAAQPTAADATSRRDTGEELPPEQTGGATGEGTAQDGTGSQTAEDGSREAVILDLTVTVTETTLELVTADQSTTLTDVEAALSLAIAPAAIAPAAIGTPDGGADKSDDAAAVGASGASDATAPVEATPPDGADAPSAAEADLAAKAGLAAALASAAPHQDGKAKAASDESVKTAATTKPVQELPPTMGDAVPAPPLPADGPHAQEPAPHAEAKDAAAKDKPVKTADALASGALPFADVPNDDSAPLPQNLTDLAAAKAKGANRTGADGDAGASAGGRGNQDSNGNAATMQPPAPQAPVADPAKPAGQSAFLSAAATEAAPLPDNAAHPSASTPTHPVFAGIEGVRATGGVEAGMTTAQLRPSRGSAGLPMGVQEQVAVHISRNVSDGNDQFTINLRPAELGRIDIKLEFGQDGRVTASVAVEKAQTLELLQRDSRNLERALQDAGLKADGNSLNFSLRGEGGQSFQDSGRQGGSGRRGRGLGGGTGEVEEAQAAYTLTLAPGRVDIQA